MNASIFEASAVLRDLPPPIVEQFHFTELEARLCLGLLQGKTLDDMADELQLPRAEVRAQFKSLLQKTKTDTEAKFVTKVLSNPSATWF